MLADHPLGNPRKFRRQATAWTFGRFAFERNTQQRKTTKTDKMCSWTLVKTKEVGPEGSKIDNTNLWNIFAIGQNSSSTTSMVLHLTVTLIQFHHLWIRERLPFPHTQAKPSFGSTYVLMKDQQVPRFFYKKEEFSKRLDTTMVNQNFQNYIKTFRLTLEKQGKLFYGGVM